MKKITHLFAFLLISALGFAQPTTNAPTPTRLAANVVSVFSDAYPSIATNLNPGWGQSGTVNPTFTVTTGNNILAYTNFNYQGTEVTATNLSAMEFLHVDIWCSAAPTSSIVQVSPINSGTGAAEVLVTINHVQGQWYSVDIPKASFTGMTWNNIIQLKFAANGAGSAVPVNIYLDNIYFWKTPPSTVPTTNAPTPTRLAANVASVFSDAYPTIATNLNPGWGQSGSVNPTFTVTTGNNILAYTNFNYQGTEVTATNLSAMEYLHVDIWCNSAPTSSIVQVSPINSGTGAAEVLVTLNHVQGQWYSVDIPKASFTGMTWNNIIQLKFAANGAGSTVPVDIYLDNIYFWKTPANPTSPPTNAPTPTHLPANVASIFSDAYPTIATNLNPGWGQSGTVNPTFSVTTGNNILAYTNFNYQGTELTATNLSTMEYLHVDIWCNAAPTSSIVQVSPINSGTGAAEVLVTINHVQGQWYSVDIPKASFTGMTWNNIIQLKFAANGAGSTVPVNIYLDNIYFWKTPQQLPLVLGFETTESGGVNGAPFGGMAVPVVENGTGSNTTKVLKIVGNTTGEVWQGINLNLTSLVSLTDSKTMTMDVLSADPITFLVKVTGGVGGPGIVAASATHTGGNTWQTVSFTFNTALDGQAALANGTYSGFVIHTYWAQGATAFTTVTRTPRTFYVDNIRGPLGTAPVIPTPTVAAPTPPNRPAADVKSIYSNAYTPLTTFAASGDLNSYDTSWCPGVTTQFLIGGNAATAMNRITGLGSGIVAGNATTVPPYQGSDLVGGCEGINFRAGSFDATSFTHFHIDIWTPIQTMALRNISLKLSNHNASNAELNAIERNITNATPSPNQLPATDPNPGTWLSFDIPLADFTIAGGGSAARNNLAEFIISTNLGIVYYDNVYFHKNTTLGASSFEVAKVKLYPNPTSNILNIECTASIQAITVYNVLGQEVMNRELNNTSIALDVSGLNSGIYVVKTVVEGITSSTKFIKE